MPKFLLQFLSFEYLTEIYFMSLNLVSRKQVAAFFGVTHETVHNWEKKGVIKPFCIINLRPRYQLQEVIDAVTKGKGGTTCN